MNLAVGRTRHHTFFGAMAALSLALTGCAGAANASDYGLGIVIGDVGSAPTLDPAGASDDGSLMLQAQLFGRLMANDSHRQGPVPDLAVSAAFTTPTSFTVGLRPRQRFANGDALTSSDVKFSFERQLTIQHSGGSPKNLAGVVSISTPNADTVVFHLKTADQAFASVLASPVGSIVDEQVFSARALTPNEAIVRANAFGGQYRIDSYHAALITLESNKNYGGSLGGARTSNISLKIYTESADARRDLQDGAIDVAAGLSSDDVARTSIDKNLGVHDAPGTETRFLIFNLATMPFGSQQSDADAKKALIVRQAVADLVDRDALSKGAFSGTALPLYSVVPSGTLGAVPAFESQYGNGIGGADATKAQRLLEAAGIPTPVALTLQFTPSEFGATSPDEYKRLRGQLQETGLFTIKLQNSAFAQFTKDVAANKYPVYQGDHRAGIADPSDSLALFGPDGPLLNHFVDDGVTSDLAKLAVEPDAPTRSGLVRDLQLRIAANVPVVPLLQTQQAAVMSNSISGATFDALSGLRFGGLVRAGR